jgi:tRNA A37 N6-isopentenylltransferase MiaA
VSYYHEILRYLPAQATAAAFIPIIQLAVSKLAKRQAVHKQSDLREKTNALTVFIASMNDIPDGDEHHAACLKDALRDRSLVFVELASLTL